MLAAPAYLPVPPAGFADGRPRLPELSPERFHELVPRDPVENLKFRLWLNAQCRSSARARTLVEAACKHDVIFFINAFGWQTNPNNVGTEDGPFITFPFQDEALWDTIRWIMEERRPVVWEKSRMQGGTYLALYLDLWLTRFHRRKRVIVMSHNEKAVENAEDEDTLFGKLDFIIGHLPSWLQDGLPRLRGVYKFQKTKSQIVGLATTVRSGVGGRAAKLTLDEVSKYNNAEAILSQTKDTGPALMIGTHYGVGGVFFDLCRRPDVCKVVMHWSKNPMYNAGLYRSDPNLSVTDRVLDKTYIFPKDYPFVVDGSPHGGPFPGLRSVYYDKLYKDRSARDIAIHWDIDPAGAARQFFDTSLIRLLVSKCTDAHWQGELEYDPVGRLVRLRKSKGGPLKVWAPVDDNAEKSGRWMIPSVYRVGGDIGAGVGSTPTCFSGGDAMTGKKVLEYMHAWIPPERIAAAAIAICHLLKDPSGNPAKLVWDATGPTGEKFGQSVLQLGFRNLWFWRDEFKLNQSVSDKPGWYSSPSSKLALFSGYETGLRNALFFNPSESALKECLAFEYSKTGTIEHGESIRTEDPTAGKVNHSDMAQADALLWKLLLEAGAGKPAEKRAEDTGEYPPWTFGWLLRRQDDSAPLDPFRK